MDSQRLPRLPREQGHKEPHDKDDDHVDPAATSAARRITSVPKVRRIAARRIEEDEKGRKRELDGRGGETHATTTSPLTMLHRLKASPTFPHEVPSVSEVKDEFPIRNSNYGEDVE